MNCEDVEGNCRHVFLLFVIDITSLTVSRTIIWRRMVGYLMNDEFERICKEAVGT
jgi:hypothetical protein